jgi:DNA primase small subunit
MRLLQNATELATALKAKVPTKIDIGPVYTQDPEKRAAYKGDTAASGFKPVERELVIDIDLTDYDDVRNSASGTSMSRKCWSLMRIAIQVRGSTARCAYVALCSCPPVAVFVAAPGILDVHIL